MLYLRAVAALVSYVSGMAAEVSYLRGVAAAEVSYLRGMTNKYLNVMKIVGSIQFILTYLFQ